MVSITKLIKHFPNDDILIKYKNQTNESWTNGKYYLCGHLQLNLDDHITQEQLNFIHNKNTSAYACNSWEMASVYRFKNEEEHIKQLIEIYTRKKIINGLFRVIVFWLSPARKRAAEKVFHPESEYMKIHFKQSLDHLNVIINETESGNLYPENTVV